MIRDGEELLILKADGAGTYILSHTNIGWHQFSDDSDKNHYWSESKSADEMFVYDGRIVALSVLGTYLNGLALDNFIFNSTLKKRICILSQHRDLITRFITDELHSGATLYEAKGAYTDELKVEVITIVNMQEYRKLMDFITVTDPDAFVTVYNVSEAVYRPKHIT